MKKRILSALLGLAMLVAMLPTAALADDADIVKYTVLIIDTSSSMSGTPFAAQKDAATKFCNIVSSAAGTNYIAIVRLSSSSSPKYQDFTTDLKEQTDYIANSSANSATNMNGALKRAGELLEAAPSTSASGSTVGKNIVLCSDGLPQSGSTTYDGPYTSSTHSNYRYGNYCYNTAAALKQTGYTIYTLGFFHDLTNKDLTFGRQLMADLASDVSMCYDVTNADDNSLQYALGCIAESASGAGHTLEKHDPVDATYNSAGSILYYQCTGCGRYFTDAYATHQVEAGGVVIPVLPLFADVNYAQMGGDWFYPSIEYCASKGLMLGTGNNYFEPYVITNRAMFVTILYRIEGQPGVSNAANFVDVPANTWYSAPVAWAQEHGIVTGYGDSFGPMDTIKREDAMTILYRYAKYKGVDVSGTADLSAFSDANQVKTYAQDAVRWVVSAGIVNGVSATSLAPESGTQRAHMSTIIQRFAEKIVPLFPAA